jgi:hypothetical protein
MSVDRVHGASTRVNQVHKMTTVQGQINSRDLKHTNYYLASNHGRSSEIRRLAVVFPFSSAQPEQSAGVAPWTMVGRLLAQPTVYQTLI